MIKRFFSAAASSIFLFSISANASQQKLNTSLNSKTCEDIGGTTLKQQVMLNTPQGVIYFGEEQDVCTLVENQRVSSILASTLLSQNSSLASTAYRTAPAPEISGSKQRADLTYCEFLGGTHRIGNFVSVAWNTKDGQHSNSMCVFADGSMISTWTLFYKRLDPESKQRPNFEPHFQNDVIPFKVW